MSLESATYSYWVNSQRAKRGEQGAIEVLQIIVQARQDKIGLAAQRSLMPLQQSPCPVVRLPRRSLGELVPV